jgi:O-antigen/teichoic acid export membrane protein
VPLMLDNVLLRMVSTASAVGLYAFSAKIVRTGITLLTDSFLVFFPRIISLAKENEGEQLRQKLLLNVQFVILLSIPMGAGFYLVADELTIVFLGDKFLPVADNLRLLAVFPFLKGVSLFLSNPVLIAHHHERTFLQNLFGGSILFVASALVLGYYYSHNGVCVALVITEVFMLAVNYLAVKRKMPSLSVFDFTTLAHALSGAALFIPYIYLLKETIDSNLVKLTLGIIGCIVIYGLFLLVIRNSFVWRLKAIISGFVLKRFR